MSRQTTDPRAAFVPRVLPWLLGAAMFGVYAVTLNHWVSFASLPAATKIAGWEWLPEVSSPLLYLVTWPFRWLPAADVPLALNLFAAFCAAWALRLLARSAAILPHDRTQDEREREHNDFGFLTIRSAWLPPALAVIVCGLQLTFWEQATNFAGETFDLLIFAFIIWSLLEYRIDELEDRLWLSAAVYGAGMAENWAMMGFLPLYVAAIVWTRRLGFFEWRFLRRMMLCGLGGMSFYLLLPLVAALSGNHTVTFWQALKLNLVPQYRVLKTYGFCIVHPGAAAEFLSLVLAYLLPLLMMAIRWPAAFGDTSRHGRALATFLFHLMHAAFLALLVWMAFDPAFSPRHLGGGVPLLTFYYLGALGIAYYSGYFLLLFGKKPAPARPEGRASWPALLNRAVVACVWLLAVAAGAGLVYRNGRHIQSENGAALRHYAELTARNLPRTGGYLLSDDPERLGLAEFALVDSGRLKNFVPLQSQSLVVPAYHRYLHGKYPLKWPNVVQTGQTNLLNPLGLIGMLALLSRTNDIFYLHPSYGYYFEEFYMEPHGLVYQLKTLPADTLLPPKPDQNLIAENEAFWLRTAAPELAAVKKEVAAPLGPNAPESWGGRLLQHFHILPPLHRNAVVLGGYYSRDLDFWGVELQRAGHLKNAARIFELATNTNPNNVVAQINLGFNDDLQAGRPASVDLSKTTTDAFTAWNDIIGTDGPFDEPSFCFRNGFILARGNGMFRQAAAAFERVRETVPDFLPARLLLGQIYVMSRLPGPALAALRGPLSHPERFSLTEANRTEVNILAAAAYFEKNATGPATRLLDEEIAAHPHDDNLLAAAAKAFMAHGLYTNALSVVDLKLKSTPDDSGWIYERAVVMLELKRYNDAVAAFTRVLHNTGNNAALGQSARFYRAVANRESGHLDAARSDYLALQRAFTNSVYVAYGLGEISWRRNQTNEAIRNYRIYLANANTNTSEAKQVAERLRALER